MAAEHLEVLEEAGEVTCRACLDWNCLRPSGVAALICVNCGTVCQLVVEGGVVHEQWPEKTP